MAFDDTTTKKEQHSTVFVSLPPSLYDLYDYDGLEMLRRDVCKSQIAAVAGSVLCTNKIDILDKYALSSCTKDEIRFTIFKLCMHIQPSDR